MRDVRAVAWVGPVLGMVACGGAPPELHLDLVRDDQIQVMAYELARPDACAPRGWIEPGEVGARSDQISCDTDDPATPTAWLGEVTVEQGDRVLGRAAYDPWSGAIVEGDFAGQTGLVVRVRGDGDAIAIPLPDVTPPVATIDDLAIDQDRLTATWHTTPAGGSAIAVLVYRDGGASQHVPAGSAAVFSVPSPGSPPAWQPTSIRVTPYAPVVVVPTDFGVAHVWTAGTVATAPLPVP